jgi:hypothetical protein
LIIAGISKSKCSFDRFSAWRHEDAVDHRAVAAVAGRVYKGTASCVVRRKQKGYGRTAELKPISYTFAKAEMVSLVLEGLWGTAHEGYLPPTLNREEGLYQAAKRQSYQYLLFPDSDRHPCAGELREEIKSNVMEVLRISNSS